MIHFSETMGAEITLAVLRVNGGKECRLQSGETPSEWGLGKEMRREDT